MARSSYTALQTPGRRALLLAAPSLTAAGWPAVAVGEQPPQGSADLSCTTAQLDGRVAAAFTRSLYDALMELQAVDGTTFQLETFKLRDREFPYYKAALKDRLAALPDLSDASGGLSSPPYFNFVSYCAWKVAARHVAEPGSRTALCRAAGRLLLSEIWPEGLERAATLNTVHRGSGQAAGTANEADVLGLITGLLDVLSASHYCCRYQVVWGELPGGWPGDWMVSQPRVMGIPPVADGPPPAGLPFQVKLHQPVDIEGSIALRSEEDGFWSRGVSSMLQALLEAAGFRSACDEYFYQDQWQGPSNLADRLLLLLGDPLEQVGIDFLPSTLVQDWELRPVLGA